MSRGRLLDGIGPLRIGPGCIHGQSRVEVIRNTGTRRASPVAATVPTSIKLALAALID